MVNSEKVALRDYLEQYEFCKKTTQDLNKSMESLVFKLVRTLNQCLGAENALVVDLATTHMSSVGSVSVTNPKLNTPFQEAYKQIARQNGEEIKSCYYNDMEIVEHDTLQQLVGSEFRYAGKSKDDLTFILESVIFHPVSAKPAFDPCGMKIRLFISKGIKIKQLTLTLVDDYSIILEEALKSYTKFIHNIMEELLN